MQSWSEREKRRGTSPRVRVRLSNVKVGGGVVPRGGSEFSESDIEQPVAQNADTDSDP